MLTNIIKTIDGHNKDALAYDYLGELHTYAELKENLHEDDVLLMTGSLYFMSQIRAYILESEQ